MLLTEIVKNSTTAISQHQALVAKKNSDDSYAKALSALSIASDKIMSALECAAGMLQQGITTTPAMTKETYDGLLDTLNDCGQAVHDGTLTNDLVKVLTTKCTALVKEEAEIWKKAADDYAKSTAGYLSLIGSLTQDPIRAKQLGERISKTIVSEPSLKSMSLLITDVDEGKKIIDSFELNSNIESFLKKVSVGRATVLDLTPDVLAWLQEKKLTPKLKIRFN